MGKPRKKYKPKYVIVDLVGHLKYSIKPLVKHDSYVIDLKLRNHAAMLALTQGRATKQDIDVLIPMSNTVEALRRMGIGKGEYDDAIQAGLAALWEVSRRGAEVGRFVLRAQEMAALNTLMDVHDAQMDVISVRELELAREIIHREYRAGKMRKVVEKEESK